VACVLDWREWICVVLESVAMKGIEMLCASMDLHEVMDPYLSRCLMRDGVMACKNYNNGIKFNKNFISLECI
jgi:hypothetical protein